MSWVMGFGRQVEVLEAAHLRQAVAPDLAATAWKYCKRRELMYREGSERRTS